MVIVSSLRLRLLRESFFRGRTDNLLKTSMIMMFDLVRVTQLLAGFKFGEKEGVWCWYF